MTLAMSHIALRQLVAQHGQQHIYTFYEQLTPIQKQQLDEQVAGVDWALVSSLVETVVKHPQSHALPADVQPAPFFPHQPKTSHDAQLYQQARLRGEDLLKKGRVAAFVVAGGQGSRLGWDGPKGTFPATPIKQKPLFQCFAEYLLALQAKYGPAIPFYIMTSPANHKATTEFFAHHRNFGLKPDQLMFFPQDMLPAVGMDGRALLESPHSLALSPNGHGGSLLALKKSGALTDMAHRGIEHISYFQVDNPIVRCVDPLFIGLHDLQGSQMSSKMLPKAFGKEKLGNFCIVNGKMTIIEYSDLPDELAEQRNSDGSLRFLAGSVALHAIRRDFIESLNAHGFALPYHRADKKVPCIDLATGKAIKPEKTNGIKMETFVFDALPLADKTIVYEADRVDEFAPIKQPDGIDSIVSSKAITTQRNAQWLEAAGINIPKKPDGTPDCIIEIAASFAINAQDVAAKRGKVPSIAPGASIYLA